MRAETDETTDRAKKTGKFFLKASFRTHHNTLRSAFQLTLEAMHIKASLQHWHHSCRKNTRSNHFVTSKQQWKLDTVWTLLGNSNMMTVIQRRLTLASWNRTILRNRMVDHFLPFIELEHPVQVTSIYIWSLPFMFSVLTDMLQNKLVLAFTRVNLDLDLYIQ
jgi:hypothetical protein